MSFIRVVTRERPDKIHNLEFAMMVFFIWYYIVPSASNKIGFLSMLVIMFIYTFYAIQKVPVSYAREIVKGVLCCLAVTFCYFFFTTTSTIAVSASHYHFKRFTSKFSQIVFSFFPVLLCLRMLYAANSKQKKIICILIFMMMGYTLVTTWQELLINGSAARSWGNFAEMSDKNVGTYTFIYAVSVLIPILTIILHNTPKKIYKIFLGVLIVAIYFFLLAAQYTLAIVIATIAIVMLCFKAIRNVRVKALIIICIPLLFLGLPTLLQYFSSRVESVQIATRLNEIAAALSGDGLGYNLSGRLELYWKSILAFFRSPIIGNRTLDFDGHATLLTTLSDVGLLGGIPYFALYWGSKKNIQKLLGNRKMIRQFNPIFISLILMGLTNPIHNAKPLSLMVWFAAPLVLTCFCSECKKE